MNNIPKTIKLIEKQAKAFKTPWITEESKRKNPYRVLISCILSLRTKDRTTAKAAKRYMQKAKGSKMAMKDKK